MFQSYTCRLFNSKQLYTCRVQVILVRSEPISLLSKYIHPELTLGISFQLNLLSFDQTWNLCTCIGHITHKSTCCFNIVSDMCAIIEINVGTFLTKRMVSFDWFVTPRVSEQEIIPSFVKLVSHTSRNVVFCLTAHLNTIKIE